MTSTSNTALQMASNDTSQHDYVIVGGGSAGCVLANRLSADPSVTVLLLEAGADVEPFWVRTPAGVGQVYFDERINWKFSTEPEPRLAGRRLYWPRGKIMGGSSAINGMVYVRGFPADYDHWNELGNNGWSWADVLPYFNRAETNDRGAGEFHGSDGPLSVTSPSRQYPATDAFIEAGVNAGQPHIADMSGLSREGVGYFQHTIRDGIRSSTARAYLRPIRNRPNLTIVAGATARKVVLENNRAVALAYDRGGTPHLARAGREVILCAGAIGSPQLLMLSGIGPGDHLQEMGIPVVKDLPGVGANLQDHLAMNAGYEVRAGMSLNVALSGWRKLLNGATYLLTKDGPLAVGTSHAVAFVRSAPDVKSPDIQLSFRPLSFAFDSNSQLKMHPFPGVQFASAMLRPQSRGRIQLRTTRTEDAPAIFANYLATPGDEKVMIETLKWIRRIASSPPLAELVVREDIPGSQVSTDEQILEFVRQTSQTLYHPVGTCMMGSGPQAVVDARLKLHGITGLRVADASIMPTIVSGNTNAPTIMIGEKASDLIIEDAKRPESDFSLIHSTSRTSPHHAH